MKRKGLLAIFLVGGGCGLPCIGLLVAIKAFGLATSNENLVRAKAEAAKVGLLTDLAKKPKEVSEKDNAAEIYRELLPKYGRSRELITEMNEEAEAFSKDQEVDWETIEENLGALSKFKSIGDQAILKPTCDFERNWSAGLEMKAPELFAMRSLVSVYSWTARNLARKNRPEEALRTLQSAAKVMRHLRQDGSHMGTNLSLTAEMAMFETIRGVLRMNRLTVGMKKRLSELLAIYGPPANVAEDFAIYPILIDDGATKRRQAFRNSFGSDDLLEAALNVKATNESLRVAVWEYSVLIQKIYLDPSLTMKHQRDKLRALGVQLRDDLNPMMGLLRRAAPFPLYDYTMPLYTDAARKLIEFAARAKTSIDPFSDKPFLQKSTPKGLIVYSVGANEADDGGSITPKVFDDTSPDKTDYGLLIWP